MELMMNSIVKISASKSVEKVCRCTTDHDISTNKQKQNEVIPYNLNSALKEEKSFGFSRSSQV